MEDIENRQRQPRAKASGNGLAPPLGKAVHHAKVSPWKSKEVRSLKSPVAAEGMRDDGEKKTEENQVVVDRKAKQTYLKGKLLGKGGFAYCYKFTHVATQHVCAGKCVAKSSLKKERARQKLLSEIKIHRTLRHRNIVRFEHFFEDKTHVYILLELCENQTLMELLKRKKTLSESHTKWFMLQILDGVKYLHENNIIHRDLKLGNLFLSSSMEIKIGDFGLATRLEHPGERKKTICGTPNYIAPEILINAGHSFEVDIWSIGVVLYTLLVGKPPFETRNVKSTYKRIQANAYSFPTTVQLSQGAKSLIRWILVKDPNRRPSIDEIGSHRFFIGSKICLTTSSTSTATDSPAAMSTESNTPAKDNFKTTASSVGRYSATSEDATLRDQWKVLDKHTRGAIAVKNSPHARSPLEMIVPSTSASSRHGSNNEHKPHVPSRLSTTASSAQRRRPAPNVREYVADNVEPRKPPNVWVTKWVDYTSKYGLGYLLRGGMVGVYFNDSTKIVIAPDRSRIEYYERQSDEKRQFTMNSYPAELEKKVTLLKHFRSYLEKNRDVENGNGSGGSVEEEKEGEELEEIKAIYSSTSSNTLNLPFVKKWCRTRHAIFFRLSNRKVQVSFFDGTEILLGQDRMVTYVDKEKKRSTIPVTEASQQPSIAKRLKYTKDVLHQLIEHHGQQGQPESQDK